MNLFHQASMAEKVIDHTNTQNVLEAAERAFRAARNAYFDAMEELPRLPSDVMNSQETRQRMIALKHAYDTASSARDKAATAEYKAFKRLSE